MGFADAKNQKLPDVDPKALKDEFEEYYNMISSSIDDDSYF
jgi:hypothetical protein